MQWYNFDFIKIIRPFLRSPFTNYSRSQLTSTLYAFLNFRHAHLKGTNKNVPQTMACTRRRHLYDKKNQNFVDNLC